MKYFSTPAILILFLIALLNSAGLYGQQHTVHAKNGMNATPRNYTYFTAPFKDTNPEATAQNKGYEHHPELGMLFAETPCDNCYELIGRRTEISKTFVKEGTNGRDIMQQTATSPMHYKDALGNWRTIKTKLEPGSINGTFTAAEQETPVQVSPQQKSASLGNADQLVQFNRNLELVYARPDGTQQIIGAADYSHYTAGDDGVYISDAWPGIDIEIYVARGAVKTNFIINNAMPAYASGQLLVRDHIGLNAGWSLFVPGENKKQHTGNIEVRNNEDKLAYNISAATAYEKKASINTLQLLEYGIEGNTLDIVLPGNFLNRAATSYPVIIDPLLSVATSTPVSSGSAYSPGPGWTAACADSNTAIVPAGVTVTDVQFTFSYTTGGGAHIDNGAYYFMVGSPVPSCRSPFPGSWWTCTDTGMGTCNSVNTTIFPEIHSCIPPPQCASYNLSVIMYFAQNYAPTVPSCSNSYISALGNLTITVFGHTVETGTITASHATICQGQLDTLTASAVYGVSPMTYSWSPGGLTGTSVTVNPTSTTTYTLTATDACGNASSTTYTVNVNPVGPVSGMTTVCVGGTTTLSDIGGAGTWVSSAPLKASVGSSTGIVTGIATGSAIINYTSLAGCAAPPVTIVIKPALASITGSATICQGSSTTLSDATVGGTWTTSAPAIATISGSGSLGVATGVSSGTATISYSTTGGGCYAKINLTVNALSPITGILSICLGATTTLSDAAPGGVWSSSNPSMATIGSVSGVVTSLLAGIDTITYSLPTGCNTTKALTVNLLSPILGTMSICQGGTTTLSHPGPIGTWTSGNPSVATINASSGLVSGISGGTAGITYTLPGGCSATTIVTINALPTITGTASVCLGGTTTLSGSTGPGTWSSSNTSIATAGATSGIVTGMAVGVCNISFTSSAGCTGYTGMNVSLATPITGVTSLCPGGNVTLSNVTTGGTWASADPSIAAVGSTSGIVSGVSGGIVAISYTNPSGCTVTISISVNPISPITGIAEICAGNTTTLNDSIPSGTWSSSNPAVATIDASGGIVNGVTAGTTAISYTTLSGCVATSPLTVDVPLPITGTTSVCLGNTSVLSNPASGGAWTSTNPAIATIDIASGLVSSIAPGTATINYTSLAGCTSTTIVTINPVAPVTGTASVCAGNTTTLYDAVGGGSWTSTNPVIASVGPSSGIVIGVTAGTTTIHYTTTAGCISDITATVHVSPTSISGSTLLCTSTTFSDGVGGGSWISSNPSVATIGISSGVAFGLAPGTVTITYTVGAGCFTATTLTVDPVVPITGTPDVCQGSTTTLGYPSTGGTWSSMNPGIASVGSLTGFVSGVTSGTTTISYTTPSGCIATVFVTVHPLLPITGSPTVCQGSTITLSDGTPGGAWTTSDASIAPIGTGSGIVTGSSAGIATINYTTAAGCIATFIVTVNPLEATTGSHTICVGNTTTLNNTTPGGGTWSSLLPAVASVVPGTGLVTGMTTGTTTIRFTSSLGCIANFSETINPLPSAITGALSVCMGSTTTLINSLAGGTWSSADLSVATIGSVSGVLAGVSTNTVTISYTSAAGCIKSAVVTVNPLPLPVTGISVICQGSTTTLYDATPGGSWSSISPAIAMVGTSGIVTGISAGTTFIKYTTPAGCFMQKQVTINALPSPIAGTTVLCEGATSALTNTLAGGTWNSSNPASATIGTLSGLLNGVSAGNATITYITAAGCFVVANVTVNPTPAISGFSFTNPTTCINVDGSVTLNGLTPGESFTVHYTFGSTPVTTVITADGTGNIIISGLAAGTYSNFSVTTSLGCSSNIIAGPVTLVLPPTPATPVAGNNTPECAGNIIKLTATEATTGVTFSWSGPGGYSSTLQNPAIPSSVVAESGIYTVTATKLACVSAPATTDVVVHPVPAITQVTSGNPSTCYGTDGIIILDGLAPGVSYSLTYLLNGTGASATKVADVSGKISLAGLKAGTYSAILVSSFTCLSNAVGPVVLSDPPPPPAPTLWSNSPICAGKTLTLNSEDAVTSLTYDWEGPNGFVSNEQSPVIPNVAMADSGIYTLTIKHLNCPTTVTENILVHPSVILTNVTQSQTVPFSGSITLHAEGAEFYMWAPSDGSLSNPNIDSPVATPQVSTVYSVTGMNTWGCPDTATVSIAVDDNITEFIPNAFTPNNDGKNDVFRIVNVKYDKLVDFTVYNRWGQLVYHNSYEPNEGWDGTYHGVPQDMGTYYYNIILTRPDGKTKTFKGEVILMR